MFDSQCASAPVPGSSSALPEAELPGQSHDTRSTSSESSPDFAAELGAIKDISSLTEKPSMTVIYSLHGNTRQIT